MDVTKVLKIQIKPTVEQIALLNDTAEVYRNACNFISENVFKFKLKKKDEAQRCPICGHVHSGNRNKHKHIFVCKNCGYRSNDDRIGAMNLAYLGDIYKTADAEGRKQVCDLGLLSTSPKCNVTFDFKPKAKKQKTKGAAAKPTVTGQLQTNSLQGVGS